MAFALLYTSTDGTTWTLGTTPNDATPGDGFSVAWDPSSSVFAELDSAAGMFSSNGTSWTDMSGTNNFGLIGSVGRVVYSPLFTLLVCLTQQKIAGFSQPECPIFTSSDGNNWTERPHWNFNTGKATFLDGVDNGTTFVTVGTATPGTTPVQISGSSTVYTVSTVTGTWTANTNACPYGATGAPASPFGTVNGLTSSSVGTAIGTDGTTFVAGGSVNGVTGLSANVHRLISTTTPAGAWSTVATPWYSLGSDVGGSFNRIIWISGKGWVIVGFLPGGAAGSVVLTSSNASTWTAQNTPIDNGGQLFDVAWSPTLSLFCAVGVDASGKAAILTSPDGVTWTRRGATNLTGQWNTVAWSPSLATFVVMGRITIPVTGTPGWRIGFAGDTFTQNTGWAVR